MGGRSARSDTGTVVLDPGQRQLLQNFNKIRPRLMSWFDRHERDYPWRKTNNWFHLLVAEMMLRRTRADQVLPVYRHFVRQYRTVASAAAVSEAELSELLRPLGLAWRGRQMHATIDYVRDHYAARRPGPEDDLLSIPGVGDYSNAMLRARLFGERRAAVDINVVRLLLRWMGRPVQAEARRNKAMIHLADRFVGTPRAASLNLAMLDFAALVCRPRSPLCSDCPLARHCKTAPPA